MPFALIRRTIGKNDRFWVDKHFWVKCTMWNSSRIESYRNCLKCWNRTFQTEVMVNCMWDHMSCYHIIMHLTQNFFLLKYGSWPYYLLISMQIASSAYVSCSHLHTHSYHLSVFLHSEYTVHPGKWCVPVLPVWHVCCECTSTLQWFLWVHRCGMGVWSRKVCGCGLCIHFHCTVVASIKPLLVLK